MVTCADIRFPISRLCARARRTCTCTCTSRRPKQALRQHNYVIVNFEPPMPGRGRGYKDGDFKHYSERALLSRSLRGRRQADRLAEHAQQLHQSRSLREGPEQDERGESVSLVLINAHHHIDNW